MALAILGVVMATVFGVIGSGLRSAHRDEDRLLLGLVAQNLLVRSQLDLNPIEGTRSGDIDGGLRWRIESEPYVLPKDILPERPTASDDMTSFAKAGKGGAERPRRLPPVRRPRHRNRHRCPSGIRLDDRGNGSLYHHVGD